MRWFNREEIREMKEGIREEEIISPSDGRILEINKKANETRIWIFLNVFDMHVQYSPINGIIEKIEYKRGEFYPAYKEKAKKYNERLITIIREENGVNEVKIEQMAGAIARSIINYKKEGEKIRKGEKLGKMLIGSSVIMTINNVKMKKKIGDKVKAKEEIIMEKYA